MQPKVRSYQRLIQERVQSAAKAADPSGTDSYAKPLAEKALDLEVAGVNGAAQRSHLSLEAMTLVASLHCSGQHSTGSALAAGLELVGQKVLHHDRLHRRDDVAAGWAAVGLEGQGVASSAAPKRLIPLLPKWSVTWTNFLSRRSDGRKSRPWPCWPFWSHRLRGLP